MTIKSKNFYVSDEFMKNASEGLDLGCYLIDAKPARFKNEITISWKEDRKAEVTESQIDEIWKQWMLAITVDNFPTFIKEQIFKDVK